MASSVVLFALFVWISSLLFFQRPYLLKSQPAGTVLSAQFHINKYTAPLFEKTFRSTPLITNRGLTFGDLSSHIKGDLALFIGENGEMSVSIHASRENLPVEILDSHRITVQEVGQDIYLLSSNLVPLEENDGFPIVNNLFSQPKQHGTLWVKSVGIGSILNENNAYSVKFPSFSAEKRSLGLSENTILYSSLSQLPVFDPSDQWSLPKFSEILVSKDAEQLDYITVHRPEIPQDEVKSILARSTSFFEPTSFETELPDGSDIEYLRVDPSSVSIEELVIDGRKVLKSESSNTSLYALSENGETYFSTSENLLRTSLFQKEDNEACPTDLFYANIHELEQLVHPAYLWRTPGAFSLLSKAFPVVFIESNSYSTFLRSCQN